MYSCSSGVFGHCLWLSSSPLAIGVSIGLQFCILNHSKTFLIYVSWERDNNRLDRSLVIFTPRMYSASPKSFISNTEDNHAFTILTNFKQFPAISMSSTYKDKMVKLSLDLLTYTQWSSFIISNS